jgi:Ca-activated chloride channel family protein
MTDVRSICGLCVLILLTPLSARAWDPFRSENGDVRRGNELLQKGQAEAASQAFEAAARALPSDPGVQLNRGLGLMATGKLPEAREAFRLSTQGSATPEIRGKAHYNMGLAFMREAEAAAGENKPEEAQKYLRESVDAFKSSLRNAPKNREAAWNLELAKRRLVEAEQKQKQKEEQEKKKEEQEKQEKQDQQDQEQQDQEQQDDQQKSDGEPKDSEQNQEPKPEDGQKEPGQDDKEPSAGEPKPDEQAKQQKPEEQPGDKKPGEQEQPSQPAETGPKQEGAQGEKPLPEHMQKALDALSESDENLQRQQARVRSKQRPRRIEKDW